MDNNEGKTDDRIKWGDLSDLNEGVEYKPLSACIFYAIQEAHQDLLGTGFGENKLEEYLEKYDEFLEEAKKESSISGETKSAYLSLKLSLQWMNELYLDVKSLTMQESTKKSLEEEGFKTETYDIPSGSINFPSLLLIQGKEDFWHMFYAKDYYDYKKKKLSHLDPYDGTIIIGITLEKAQKQTKKHDPTFLN